MRLLIQKGYVHRERGLMEILGKKSKVLLVLLLVLTLTASLIMVAVFYGAPVAQAASGSLAQYANANIGDIVTFGNYYQDANGTSKTPIEWLVVDKNDKTGQLTLLAKHVLAGGSYWGNWFYNGQNAGGLYSPTVGSGPGGLSTNQSWADSTLRAWLNNLERTDVHGDKFTASGIQLYTDKVTPSKAVSVANNVVTYDYQHSDLKHSVGYSNKNLWTGLKSANITGAMPEGYFLRPDADEIVYRRPKNTVRPAVNGFLDEAFSQEEQELIVPKVIPGELTHEWPSKQRYTADKSLTPTTVDKIWVPSNSELNISQGMDYNGRPDDGNGGNNWSVSTDNGSNTAFAFFRQFQTVQSLSNAVKASSTDFDRNALVSNYSIPLDVDQSNINASNSKPFDNLTDYWGEIGARYYWTRTPSNNWHNSVGVVEAKGGFTFGTSHFSHIGARPALILSYK